MAELFDKIIIFLCCITLYIPNSDYDYLIVPIIVFLAISAFTSYFENNLYPLIALILLTIACFFVPTLLYFVPLLCYDMFLEKRQAIVLIVVIPYTMHFTQKPSLLNVIPVLFIAVAYLLKHRTVALLKLKNEYYKLRDDTKELSSSLENKNKELMQKQDYEVNLAILDERNRIAREIHDNVGHVLSSSILQVGALIVMSHKDNIKEGLATVKSTLSLGMDSIRSSVHDLHEESINLNMEIKKLVDLFTFCPITLDYNINNNLDKKLKYSFISIIKEALSNIIKHSNATVVSIILREHPALIQLVIQDNGSKKDNNNDDGIGLNNIIDRVSNIGGYINIDKQNGFKIFISVPKE